MASLQLDIALCDDDEIFLHTIERCVGELLHELGQPFRITLYQSAPSLMEALRGGRQFSLLMLDVVLEEFDGIKLARAIRKSDPRTPLILFSSNRDYALTGYEVNALRFLAKPIDPDRLREALTAALSQVQTRTLMLRGPDGLHRVDVDGILYAEVWERGVTLHLAQGEPIYTPLKISALEQQLPKESFFRCHQGYLINLAFVRQLHTNEALMTNGSRVPISRYKLADLRTHFTEYLNR